MEGLYFQAEKIDGYLRDQNVFSDGISIEDTMNLAVRYKNGAQLSYSLTAYSPWEGYRIAFNGTRGRLELDEMENSYVAAGNSHIGDGLSQSRRLMVFPHWEKPYHVDVVEGKGGHGGAICFCWRIFLIRKAQRPSRPRRRPCRWSPVDPDRYRRQPELCHSLPVRVDDLLSV